jgi:hypothetical protein
MHEIRSMFKIFVRKPEGKGPFEDICEEGKINMKRIVKT